MPTTTKSGTQSHFRDGLDGSNGSIVFGSMGLGSLTRQFSELASKLSSRHVLVSGSGKFLGRPRDPNVEVSSLYLNVSLLWGGGFATLNSVGST